PVGNDLWKVRNVKPLLTRFGTVLGVGLSGLDMWTNTLFGFSLFGTLKHGKPDYASLKPAAECSPISYPKPDGKVTFDRLSSVFLSNTNHEEDQPVHLLVADPGLQKTSEHDVFAGPSARYCPAGEYEWVEEAGAPKFVINAQNCVHCKPATSRIPIRTSPGFRPKVVAGRTIPTCKPARSCYYAYDAIPLPNDQFSLPTSTRLITTSSGRMPGSAASNSTSRL